MRFATIALVFACAAPAFGQSNPPDSTRIVAVEDAFAVFSDSSLTVAGSGLLSNDEIVGVDSVVAVLVDPPAHGAVLLAPSGAFTYTPATGFSGDDTFSYHIQSVPRQEIAMDPVLSSLQLWAKVSTLIGSDTDQVDTPVGGSISFFLEPNLPPYSGIQVVKMDLSLADSVDLEFRFGGLITLGRLFVSADSGGIRLPLNAAGPATAVVDSAFTQTGNKLGVLGNVQLVGTGLIASSVPDDPQVFDTETDFDLSGRVFLADADQLHIEIPVAVQDTVELSGTGIELSLEGTVQGAGDLLTPVLSNIVTVTLSVDPRTNTGVEDGLPATYALDQNYPNPFNPVTRIAYSLAKPGAVQLTVFDLLGREVATLVDGFLPAGRQEVDFDASRLPSGMYLYRITSEGFSATRTMVLMK